MKTTNWTGWLAAGGITVLALAFGVTLLTSRLWGRVGGGGYNDCGWNGWGMAGAPGMMGFNPLGWIGMSLMWLFPLGLLLLLAVGGVWLVQSLTHNKVPLTAAAPGPSPASPN